jgi:hypothetical protein
MLVEAANLRGAFSFSIESISYGSGSGRSDDY